MIISKVANIGSLISIGLLLLHTWLSLLSLGTCSSHLLYRALCPGSVGNPGEPNPLAQACYLSTCSNGILSCPTLAAVVSSAGRGGRSRDAKPRIQDTPNLAPQRQATRNSKGWNEVITVSWCQKRFYCTVLLSWHLTVSIVRRYSTLLQSCARTTGEAKGDC